MQQAMADMLAKRRDRAIAVILGVKERECDPYLPAEASARLRKVVLDQLNDFYELTMDLARSFDQGDVVLNDAYLDKIDELHSGVVEIQRLLAVNGNGRH